MKHLIRLAFLALLASPFSLSAERSIMDPVVYDLRGALTDGFEVAAVVTDAGELSEFTFDTASSYLTLLKPATFYYALCMDTAGQLAYLYMGPKEVAGSSEPFIQELTPLPSAAAQGLKTTGKGYLISLASGVVVFAAYCHNRRRLWICSVVGVCVRTVNRLCGYRSLYGSGVSQGCNCGRSKQVRNSAA